MTRLFIEFDGELYRLMCDDGRMSPMPAGERLFRARPHPAIHFSHESLPAAEADLAKLRTYLAALPSRKPSKKEVRAHAG